MMNNTKLDHNAVIDTFLTDTSHYNKLFELVKINKTKEIIKLLDELEKDPDIDLNIKDKSNNNLIHLVLLHNNTIVLKKILKFNIDIGIFDENGKTILYNLIKFGYHELLLILLEYDENNIGTSIVNFIDKNGDVPLSYTLALNNEFAFNLLLDYGADVNIINKLNENILHLMIQHRSFHKYIDKIIDKIDNINSITNNGDSYLHLAINLKIDFIIIKLFIDKKINVNLYDYDNNYTSLFYAVANNDKRIVNLLLDNGANIFFQDLIGNTVLHHTIIENMIELSDTLFNHLLMLSDDIILRHINNVNVYGNSIIHDLLLKRINDHFDKFLIKLLKYCNLNIQNNDGQTILHLLLKNQDLANNQELLNLLRTKKLNMFIKDKFNVRPFDYIDKKLIDKFEKVIIDSYLKMLTLKNNWDHEWQNECRKINNTNCRKQILNEIKNNYSYPVKIDKLPFNIPVEEELKFVTFTGTKLDIFIGLKYLLNKYPKLVKSVNSNFNHQSEVNNLINKYKLFGIRTVKRELLFNVEIIWTYQKLIIPSYFIDHFLGAIKQTKIFIIPIGIELSNGSHANYLIYYTDTRVMERFEPHGSDYPSDFNYNPQLLDEILESKFKEFLEFLPNQNDQNNTNNIKLKYIKPKDYLPRIGFQQYDIIENKRHISDPKGFCALWCIWYVDLRLQYLNISSNKLVRKMTKYIQRNQYSFRTIIRNYSKIITDYRDSFLVQMNKDINDYANNNFKWNEYLDLLNLLKL
jgi:ankyrin repeat protein